MTGEDGPTGISPIRVVGTAAAAGVLLLVVLASLDLPHLGGRPALLATTSLANFTAAVGCVFAASLLWLAPREPAARALALVLVAAALLYLLTVVPLVMWGDAAIEPARGASAGAGAYRAILGALVGVSAAALMRFTASFPDEVTEEELAVVRDRGTRAGEELPGPLRMLAVSSGKLEKWTPERFRYKGDFIEREFRRRRSLLRFVRSPGLWAAALALGLAPVLALWLLPVVLVVAVTAAFTGAVVFVSCSWLTSDQVGRRKIVWFATGAFPCLWLMTVGTGMAIYDLVQIAVGGSSSTLGVIMFLGTVSPAGLFLMAGLAAAVFVHGALDPELAIRRTVLYGSLGVALAFLFALLENALSEVVAVRLALPPGMSGWGAAGLLAVGVVPLHDWTRRTVDRLLEDRLPDTDVRDLERMEGVVLLVSHRPPAQGGDAAAGDRADSVVLLSAARKIANRNGGHAAAGGLKEGRALVVLPDSEGTLEAAGELLRTVRSACEALEIPLGEIRVAAHGGEVSVGGDTTDGPALETLALVDALGGADVVLLTEAVYGGPPPRDEIRGLEPISAGTVEPPGAGEALEVWTVPMPPSGAPG